jgi:hypothetical protein
MMDNNTVVQMIREFGVPTMFAVAMGYTVLRGLQWFAERVYLPQQDRSFRFMDKLEAHLDKMSENQTKLVGDLQRLGDAVDSLESRMAQWEKKENVL